MDVFFFNKCDRRTAAVTTRALSSQVFSGRGFLSKVLRAGSNLDAQLTVCLNDLQAGLQVSGVLLSLFELHVPVGFRTNITAMPLTTCSHSILLLACLFSTIEKPFIHAMRILCVWVTVCTEPSCHFAGLSSA